MNLIDFCLWLLLWPFFIFYESMQMCVIKTYQCQPPSTSAALKKNYSIWLDLCLPFSEKGYSDHLSLMTCFILAAISIAKKKIKDLISGVRDFGGLFDLLVGYISIWRWCLIAADTAIRLWKSQRKNVLNNNFCLLQSAQILLVLIWSTGPELLVPMGSSDSASKADWTPQCSQLTGTCPSATGNWWRLLF